MTATVTHHHVAVAALDGASEIQKTEWNEGHDVTIVHADLGSVTANQHHNEDHKARHEPGGADAMTVDAAAATGSLRTLGTGAAQAAQGTHTHGAASYTGRLLEYDPDNAPTSPSASDDEFRAGSLAGGWTQFGTPDTVDAASRVGVVEVIDNDSTECGFYEAYTPGAAAFTVVCKVAANLAQNNFDYAGISVRDSSGTNIASFNVQSTNTGTIRVRYLNGASETDPTPANQIRQSQTGWYYLKISRDASQAYTIKMSDNGWVWYQVATFTGSGTVARLYLQLFGGANGANAMFDFVRAFTSQTDVIGSAVI